MSVRSQWLSRSVGVLSVLCVGMGLGATLLGRESPAWAATCGEPGLPACPLQSFMRAQVAAPLAQKDMAALAAGLDRVPAMQPEPSWTTWSSFAKAGAEAARKGDVLEVRKSCKGCHDAFRASYRKDFRQRPLP